MNTRLARIVLIGIFVAVWCSVGEAASKKKKGKGGKKPAYNPAAEIKSTEAKLARLRSVLADATNRMALAQAAQGRANSLHEAVKSALHGAQSSQHNAELALKQVEREIERDAPEEYKKLREEFERAKEKLRQEQDRVLGTPEYKQAYAAAKNSLDSDDLLKVRKDALAGDPKYQTALFEYKRLGGLYESKRLEVYKQNPRWSQEAETASQAGLAAKDQENRLQSSLMTLNSAKSAMRKSSAVVGETQQLINVGEAKLAQLRKTATNVKKKK